MENSGALSDSYILVEQRIRQGELSLSEVEHLLDGLVGQRRITSTEQQALLELAWEMNTKNTPPS